MTTSSKRPEQIAWASLVLSLVFFGVTFIIAVEVAIVFGKVHPMLAAFLHTVSSALVVFNSARMVRFGEHLESHAATPRGSEAVAAGKVSLQPV